MRLKWTKADIAYFSKPIQRAERNDDWVIWAILFVASCSGIIYLVMR